MHFLNKMFHPSFVGVFLVAMATLAMEVILTRVFSFSIWYHFAYLTINIALLGFGSSGSILTAFPGIARGERWKLLVVLGALLSSISLTATFVVLARYPLEPTSMFQHPLRFTVALILYYIGVGLPFFFAGTAISVTLSRFAERVSVLYFWDLCGAAIGSLLALLLLNWIGAPGGILCCSAIMIIAAACFSTQLSTRLTIILTLSGLIFFSIIPYVKDSINIIPCSSKTLALVYRNPDIYKPLFTQWNAINRVDVYKNIKKTDLPFWAFGAISSTYKGSFPDFLDMQYDAHNGSNIYNFKGDLNEFRFLDYHMLKTPYVVLDKPNVLIIGVGGCIDVFNALKNNAASITAIELQPITVSLLKERFSDWVGNIFKTHHNIRLIAGEGRNFINSNKEKYDLIEITVTDTFAALNTGAYVLMESYLYTEEAFATYFDHLTDNGIMSIIVGDHLLRDRAKYPPLNSRLILQYLNMLKAKGVTSPQQHIAILGQYESNANMACWPLLKKTPFTSEDMLKLRSFAETMGFFLVYDPLADNTPDTVLKRILNASDEARGEIISQAPYNIKPTTDNNPFFYNFIKWKTVLDVLNFKKFEFSTPVFGQAVLLILLVQSIAFSLFFIILPLLISKKTTFARKKSLGYLVYFFSIGLGFMFMEISFIQKFVLFLGYPAHAFAITLFSLLLFSGIGSFWTGRFTSRPEAVLKKAITVLVPVLLLYIFFLDALFGTFIGESFTIKAFITILTQMPLGLVLGMFFPLGIKLVNEVDPRMVPWAWGANGMSSVVSTIIAIIIAMSYGFKIVSFLAIIIYVVGTVSILATKASEKTQRT